MSEIEKMRRYIEKSKVPRTPRYDASINEIIAIACLARSSRTIDIGHFDISVFLHVLFGEKRLP